MCFPNTNFDCRYCLCIPRFPQHSGSDGTEEKLCLPSPSLNLETKPGGERQTPVLSPATLAPLLRSHHSSLDFPRSPRYHHCLHKVIKRCQSCQQTLQTYFRIHQTGGDPVTIILLISFISLTLLLPYQLRQLSIELKLIESIAMVKTLRQILIMIFRPICLRLRAVPGVSVILRCTRVVKKGGQHYIAPEPGPSSPGPQDTSRQYNNYLSLNHQLRLRK